MLPKWLSRRAPPPAANPEESRFEFLDENQQPIEIKSGEEASGIENAKDVLKDALLDRASDVHIEPSAVEYRVRFRIDGLMHPRMKFSPAEGLRLVAAIKTLAQIDIADRRKAQDGRFGARRARAATWISGWPPRHPFSGRSWSCASWITRRVCAGCRISA